MLANAPKIKKEKPKKQDSAAVHEGNSDYEWVWPTSQFKNNLFLYFI